MPARFITFEGLDGSGKTTHLERAAARLRSGGLALRVTREPGGTPLGQALREIFLGDRWPSPDPILEALLLLAARRHHLAEVIQPALDEGRHVLCDRFTDSTLAYQGYGRGMDLEALTRLDALVTGGRRPDLTLLFDLPPEVARERGRSEARRRSTGGVNRLDAEDVEFYRRVRDGFLALAAGSPDRFRVVRSAGTVEETALQVDAALAGIL